MTTWPIAVSVIIPSRNRPNLVRRAVESVARQGREDVEVVVIDDASTCEYDVTGILATKALRYLRNATRLGPAASRNRGIAVASGDWIAFLDDDDEWLPGFVDQTLAALSARESDLSFCWSGVVHQHYDDQCELGAQSNREFKDSYGSDDTLFSDALTIGCGFGLTVHRHCFERIGGFDASYTLVEDTEFIFRLLDRGCRPHVAPGVLCRIHHRPDPERLTSVWRIPVRLAEIDRLLLQYASFLDRFGHIRDWMATYVADLQKAYAASLEGERPTRQTGRA